MKHCPNISDSIKTKIHDEYSAKKRAILEISQKDKTDNATTRRINKITKEADTSSGPGSALFEACVLKER